jgi:hypothetical protein
MSLSGHYVGRNPRNAPAAEDDSSSGGDDDDGTRAFITVAGGRKARIAAAKNHQAAHYRSREEEDAALDRHLEALRAEAAAAAGSDAEADEDAALDAELIRFHRRLAAGANNMPAAAAATKPTPKETAALRAARELRAAGHEFPVRWVYANDDPDVVSAEVKVAQLEAAIRRPVPTGDAVAVLFWHTALRPPWPPLGVVTGVRHAKLSALCRAIEDRFGVRCAGLMPLDADQQRVALLATWLVQSSARGLAFIVSPTNEAARDLSKGGSKGEEVAVVSLGDVTAEAKEQSTWAYVGARSVPVCLIEAARPPAL